MTYMKLTAAKHIVFLYIYLYSSIGKTPVFSRMSVYIMTGYDVA